MIVGTAVPASLVGTTLAKIVQGVQKKMRRSFCLKSPVTSMPEARFPIVCR